MNNLYGFDRWLESVDKVAEEYNMSRADVLNAIKLIKVNAINIDIRDLCSWHYTHEYMQYIMGENYLKLGGNHEGRRQGR